MRRRMGAWPAALERRGGDLQNPTGFTAIRDRSKIPAKNRIFRRPEGIFRWSEDYSGDRGIFRRLGNIPSDRRNIPSDRRNIPLTEGIFRQLRQSRFSASFGQNLGKSPTRKVFHFSRAIRKCKNIHHRRWLNFRDPRAVKIAKRRFVDARISICNFR